MADFYSIAGAFDDTHSQGNPFGGFFFKGEDANISTKYNKTSLVGKLVDPYGISTIEGDLSDKKLTFTKVYQREPPKVKRWRWIPFVRNLLIVSDPDRNTRIFYEFDFDPERNLWVGKFDSKQTGEGATQCGLSK